jgi:hypothetical protein
MSDQIRELIARVTALEVHVGIGHSPPEPVLSRIPTTTTDQRLSKPALARRWGVSSRTIDRRRVEVGFPAAEIVNLRPYWWLSKIIAYERACAARGKLVVSEA